MSRLNEIEALQNRAKRLEHSAKLHQKFADDAAQSLRAHGELAQHFRDDLERVRDQIAALGVGVVEDDGVVTQYR